MFFNIGCTFNVSIPVALSKMVTVLVEQFISISIFPSIL